MGVPVNVSPTFPCVRYTRIRKTRVSADLMQLSTTQLPCGANWLSQCVVVCDLTLGEWSGTVSIRSGYTAAAHFPISSLRCRSEGT